MDDFLSFIQALREPLPDRRLAQTEAEHVTELQATRALELLDTTEPAVDVGCITDMRGVNAAVVSRLSVGGKPQSGHSWFDDNGTWHVQLNAEDSRTRKRFTLAHELKHAIDHAYIDVLYHGRNTSDKQAADRAEAICDHFAGCLLMPRPWLKALWGNGYQDRDKLAALFGVSPAAMSVRLATIGLVKGWPRHHWTPRRSWDERSIHDYLRAAPTSPELCPAACGPHA